MSAPAQNFLQGCHLGEMLLLFYANYRDILDYMNQIRKILENLLKKQVISKHRIPFISMGKGIPRIFVGEGGGGRGRGPPLQFPVYAQIYSSI